MKHIKTYELFDKWRLPREVRQLSKFLMEFISSCIDKKYKVSEYVNKVGFRHNITTLEICIKMNYVTMTGEYYEKFITLYYNYHKNLIIVAIKEIGDQNIPMSQYNAPESHKEIDKVVRELQKIREFLILILEPISKKHKDDDRYFPGWWVGKDDLDELKKEITKEKYLFWKETQKYNL